MYNYHWALSGLYDFVCVCHVTTWSEEVGKWNSEKLHTLGRPPHIMLLQSERMRWDGNVTRRILIVCRFRRERNIKLDIKKIICKCSTLAGYLKLWQIIVDAVMSFRSPRMI